MARPSAPALPTKHQIRETFDVVSALHPGARISRVGPEGVEFTYPDATTNADGNWHGKPFSAEDA